MAAYRAGCRLRDERSGRVHDYARRRGVAYAGIVLPDHAPAWAGDREQLWNRVEAREGRSDAQLGREVQLSLPHELDGSQRRELALGFARHLADEYGFAVDVAIHAPGDRGDDRNHHAHLLLTSRALDAGHKTGWAKTKDRRFDAIAMQRARSRNAVEDLRAVWETKQNEALAKADVRDANGRLVQVDRRSYARQGLSITPTLHRGPEKTAIKRRCGTPRLVIPAPDLGQSVRPVPITFAPLGDANLTAEAGLEASRGAVENHSGTANHRQGRSSFITHHTAEEVRAFNLSLLEPSLESGLNPGSQKNQAKNSAEVRLIQRLDTDFNNMAFHVRSPLGTSLLPAPAWRWRGLDALNQELAEPTEGGRKKDRDGGKGKQPILLNTDPRQEGREQMPSPPEPERQDYGRSG